MSTNVSLTPELERFARDRVSEGRYNNVSEVVRDALRLLQDMEQARRTADHEAKANAAAVERDRARRAQAFKALIERWDTQAPQDIGPWTRDELYE